MFAERLRALYEPKKLSLARGAPLSTLVVPPAGPRRLSAIWSLPQKGQQRPRVLGSSGSGEDMARHPSMASAAPVILVALALALATVLAVRVAPFVLARVATGEVYVPAFEKIDRAVWLALAGALLGGLTALRRRPRLA
jgi:hypothetical protein